MIRKTMVALALMAATAAQAQTTSCQRTIVGMDCSTEPDGGQQFANGMAALGNAIRARRQYNAAKAAYLDAVRSGRCDEARALAMQYGQPSDVSAVSTYCHPPQAAADQKHQDVAALVAKGDCEGAKKAALSYGDMDLAEQAVRICTPAPTAALGPGG